MNEGLTELLPTGIGGWITTIIMIILGFISLLQRFRLTEINDLRSSNQTLRDLVKDQQSKIDTIQDDVNYLKREHENNLRLIGELQGANNSMRDMIKSALDNYFITHPRVAKELAESFEKKVKKVE